MSSAWLQFARFGDPGHPGLPPWPPYALDIRPTMIFDDECRVALDPYGDRRRVWSRLRTGEHLMTGS
jgi:para-nitrobenzyl esterase